VKIKNESENIRESGKIEVIKSWPIPTTYKFLFFIGISILTSGTFISAAGLGINIPVYELMDIDFYFSQFLGVFMAAIGFYLWNKKIKHPLI